MTHQKTANREIEMPYDPTIQRNKSNEMIKINKIEKLMPPALIKSNLLRLQDIAYNWVYARITRRTYMRYYKYHKIIYKYMLNSYPLTAPCHYKMKNIGKSKVRSDWWHLKNNLQNIAQKRKHRKDNSHLGLRERMPREKQREVFL